MTLYPFAKAMQFNNQIRYVASNATDAEALLAALCEELHCPAAADPAQVETTLLIYPNALSALDPSKWHLPQLSRFIPEQ